MEVAPGDWFARRRVDDRTWHLWEQHVRPFLRCNVWFVRGRDRSLLVDSGLGVVSLSHAAADLFEGHALAAVATHHHFDHVGSFHEFDDRYAHPSAAPFLASSDGMPGALRRSGYPPAVWQYFHDAGYVLDDELLTALPRDGFDVDAYAVEPCPANHALVEGDVIDLGDIALEVLDVPGHSPGHVIFLMRTTPHTVFDGDVLFRGSIGRYDFPGSNGPLLFEGIRTKLFTLPPDTVVYPGHGPVTTVGHEKRTNPFVGEQAG